jgi:hypothetical protein
MDLFRQTTDAVTSAFLNSDPLDGDSLISGLVDAFNGLADSIGSIFSPPQTTPAVVPVENVGADAPQLAADPHDALAAVSDLLNPVPPADVESEPASGSPGQDAVQSDTPATPSVQEQVQEALPAQENGQVQQSNEPGGTTSSPAVQPTGNGQSHATARSVMIRARLQMVQSLKSLIGVFDSADPSAAQQSSLKASAQVSARYHVDMIGRSVDGQV